MPKIVDPEHRALAVEALRAGASCKEVVAELAGLGTHVTERTLGNWAKHAGVTLACGVRDETPATRPAAPADEPPLPPLDLGGRDTVESILALRDHAARSLEQAARDFNHTAVSRLTKQLVDLSNQLLRAQRQARENADGIVVTQAEIDAATETLRERVRAYAQRPLLCAHCSRELSIKWGGVPLEEVGKEGKE